MVVAQLQQIAKTSVLTIDYTTSKTAMGGFPQPMPMHGA
jgi:hypothetical protein